MNIQRYITMLLYKLKKKDKNIKLVTIYSFFYNGKYEQFMNKRDLLNRMIEINKELKC